MPLRDFITERRLLVRGGRRYVCTKPTLATIVNLIAMFPREVVACHLAAAKIPDHMLQVRTAVALFLRAGAAADEAVQLQRVDQVVNSCVQLVDGEPGEVAQLVVQDLELAVQLVGAILQLCDVRRIIQSLNLPATTDADEEASASDGADPADVTPSDQELAITNVARVLGVDVTAVQHWPYELWLTMSEDIVPLLLPRRRDGKALGSTEPTPASMFMGLPGIGVHTDHGAN